MNAVPWNQPRIDGTLLAPNMPGNVLNNFLGHIKTGTPGRLLINLLN